ncbi:MAG: hypothetical protein V1798_01805 [Pseudomonadota bacterium]
MHRNRFFLIVPVLLLAFGCVKRPPDLSHPAGAPEIKAVHNALGVTVWNRGTSYILHNEPDAKGVISEEKKGSLRALVWGLAAPIGFAVDSRRAQFYVIDGSHVAIYKIKNPGEAPKIIEVAESSPLSDITFSIMNRRAYAVSPEARAVWVVNPVDGKADRIVGPEVFRPEAFGKPTRVMATTDGMRLYIATAAPAQLLAYDLHRRKLSLLAALPEGTEPMALDLYKEHFIVTGGAEGEVYAIHRKTLDVSSVALPPEAFGVVAAVAGDVGLVLLVKEGDDNREKLIRTPFKIQEMEDEDDDSGAGPDSCEGSDKEPGS